MKNVFSGPKKSLGQNFLQDEVILEKIIEAGELTGADVVVEIGPGKGCLTKALLKKAGRVVALEKDEALTENLEKEAWCVKNQEKIDLFSADALEFDFESFFQKEKIKEYKLIANIPYYITGKLLRTFQELELRPTLAVLLVQKEVAERICAPRGEKSLLSVASDYFGKAQIIINVKKESFFPVPKVDSAVLKIFFKKDQELAHSDAKQRKRFFQLVKMGFASRRKTLLNNLKGIYPKEKMESFFVLAGMGKKVRAQELELSDWLALEKFFGA